MLTPAMESIEPALHLLRETPHGGALLASIGAVAYLCLVRSLRYRRRNKIQSKFRGRPLSSMTLDEAHEIRKILSNLEFPTTYTGSLFFALFKTYAIPTISKLLAATGQLGCPTQASKRAADTAVLISEFTQTGHSSSRRADSIARMNYLHSRYQKAGKISDDDMLYTLSLFALEPSRWVGLYEWRAMTEVELCAEGLFWRDVGEAMEIPYGALERFMKKGEDGKESGLTWLRAIEEWSLEYEAENAVPHEANKKVAEGTLDIVLYNAPASTHGFFNGIISALLDPKTRAAMMMEDPTPTQRRTLSTIFDVKRFLMKYLTLPRTPYFALQRIDEVGDPATGRYAMPIYFSHPWYVKPTFASRWGPWAWYTWLVGGDVPAKDGPYRPGGYLIPEVGPVALEEKGATEMEATREKLRQRRGGCAVSAN